MSEGRVALKFNLSSIPVGAQVTKAELSLFRIGDFLGYDYAATMQVYPITESWSDQSSTWETLAQSVGAIATTKELPKGTKGELTFDVSTLVKEMVDGTTDNHGFMIGCTTTYTGNSNGQFSFLHSSESNDNTSVPKLTVTYTGTDVLSKEKVKAVGFNAKISEGVISLQLPNTLQRAQVNVVSLQGAVIASFNGSLQKEGNSIAIPTSIAKGLYIVSVDSPTEVYSTRVLYK